jgi:hypothetical protein
VTTEEDYRRALRALEALDRAVRRGILGLPSAIDRKRLAKRVLRGQSLNPHERQFIADMLRGKRPTARPKSADVALDNDGIAQDVIFAQAFRPRDKLEAIIKGVGELHGVKRSKVFEALRSLTPERRAGIEAFAKRSVEYQAEVAARAAARRK